MKLVADARRADTMLRRRDSKDLATKRPYQNIGFFFLLVLTLVIAGFTPRIADTPFFGYFSQAGKFKEISPLIHLHALAAVAWFTLLSAQPFFVRANRFDLHRLLGKASVVVVALFSFTALQIMKKFYTEGILTMPRDTVLSLLAQSFSALSLFIVFYTLALLRRRNVYQHVAFMVAASLTAGGPGLIRLGLAIVGGLPGILVVIASIYVTLIGFLLYAKIQFKQPLLRSPYLPIILLFLLGHAMDFAGSQTAAWLLMADKIVSVW